MNEWRRNELIENDSASRMDVSAESETGNANEDL